MQATTTCMLLLDWGRLEGTRVIPERTEVIWGYWPADLFEAPYRCQEAEFDLLIEAGKAVATLRVAQDPVEARLVEDIQQLVENLCAFRQVQVHREYKVEGHSIHQCAGERKSLTVCPPGFAAATRLGVPGVDTTARDAAGNLVRDTKAERIAKDTLELDLSVAKRASPLLRSAMESYGRAVSDPSNELVCLYEVRDLLAKHYDGEDKARKALNITAKDWARLCRLANDAPIEQGRHRGKHAADLRPATDSELQEAREIVCRWITALARVVQLSIQGK